MKKQLLILALLTSAFINCFAQPTKIYQPNGSATIFGRASADSLSYYVNLGYSPFSVIKIDGNNNATQVCDLPASTMQLMLFNNSKGIYKTSAGYSLYNGTNHIAIPITTIPSTYPNNYINEDFFHIGTNTYFTTGGKILKTDYSSVANIQTLYTSSAATILKIGSVNQ